MALRFTALKGLLPAIAGALLVAPLFAAQPAPAPAVAPPPAVAPAAPVAAAVTTQPIIYLSPDGTTIYVIGTIMDDSFKRFDAVLSKAPKVRTLYLSSPGGLTLEARLMAAMVRKRRLNTYVEHYCASACTQLFVSGVERVIGREAVLGFHQAVGVDRRGRATRVNKATTRALDPTLVFGINGNDTLRLAYELAGLDQGFIKKVLAKNHEEMWFPTVKELTDAGVITRQADKPEFALPEDTISQADLKTKLGQRPVWDRAAKLFPTAYQTGFDSAWRLGNSGSNWEAAISSGRADLVVAMMSRVAIASDSVLDRHLKLYGATARAQAELDYPMCRPDLDEGILPPTQAVLDFERVEDGLLVEAVDTKPATKAMSGKDAMKIFTKDIMPLLPSNFGRGSDCKSGFQMVAAVDRLTGSKRIKAYRAMLSLPGALGL